VDAGELAGAVALAWREGAVVDEAAVGSRHLTSGLPVERNPIFRIAAMTKPVTTVAALILFDEGRFALDDPITICAPELAHLRVLRDPEGSLDATDEAERSITSRDLMTHRSGLTYGDFHRGPIVQACAEALGSQIDNALTPDEWIGRVATLPLVDQPGARFHYGISTDLLGFLIARLDGQSLGEVLTRRVLAPLDMRDTGFAVSPDKRDRRAALSGFDDEGRLTRLTATPGRHALEERPDGMTFESGGGGLWSTVDDYLMFARMLLGDPDMPVLLRVETRALMTSNQLTPQQRAATRLFGRSIVCQGPWLRHGRRCGS
jgi:CubicO group peptidase (beta-lactamase class C family)